MSAGFDTAALRRVVLDAWTASPARFREDANAEEELVLGAYRDRLIVELAQNAADAAARADVPGRVRFDLRDGVLTVANTGAPLDAEAVLALSTLRASAKREQTGVGRFGVGFAATLAVSDAPEIHSRTGAVRWSADDTRRAVTGVPALAAELARRDGAVPVLRLPFDAEARVPAGYDTAVVLPLRGEAAVQAVRAALDAVDDVLLLALEALVEVDLGSRVLTARRTDDAVQIQAGAARTTWRVLARSGTLDPALLADRPVEERSRTRFSLTWALPDTTPSTAGVLHAPTPTDDPLDLPALLLGTFGLDSSRRRVAPGALCDFLVATAAAAYCDLVRDTGDVGLVPGALGVGDLDAALRREILQRLADTPFLPAADGGRRLAPREAVHLRGADGDLLAALAEVVPGLLGGDGLGSVAHRLGARVLGVADVVEDLSGLDREPAWWARLYEALRGQDPETLRGLPVPLAHGGAARDPRQVLLPGEVPAEVLIALGLRAAHPDAAHPLLERLGARRADAAGVLAHPGLRALPERAWDAAADERRAIVEAVLILVALDPPLDPAEWLGDLPLPDEDGRDCAARDLLLPDSPLRSILDPDEVPVVDADLVDRFGRAALAALGVLDGFGLVREVDVVLDPDGVGHDLAAEAQWLESIAGAGLEILVEFVAVRDLDLVRQQAWPQALRLLAEPPLRAAVLEPARILRGDGRGADVPSYTAWWLRTHPVLDGRRPMDLRLRGGDPLLVGLWDEAPVAVDAQFARGLGLRVALAEVLAEPDGPAQLLSRLADPGRDLTGGQLGAVYRLLADVDPQRVPESDLLRVPDGAATRVVAAEEVVVVDAPDLIAVVSGHPLPAPTDRAAALAEALLVPLASALASGAVSSRGVQVAVPDAVAAVLPGAPAAYVEHDRLLVRGPRGDVEVPWRWTEGTLHAATAEGLAFGLAWAAGEWSRRWLALAVLQAPNRAGEHLLGDAFGAAP